MRFVNRSLTAVAVVLACSCGSSKSHPDLAPAPDMVLLGDLSGPDGAIPPNAAFDLAGYDGAIVSTGPNVVPMIVDAGPEGNGFNVGYISVKICAPGSTTNCQTIDHISVDTGSVGLHIISSVINPTVFSALPNYQSGGQGVSECYTYADGFVYGSVRTADVSIGGESAPAMAFMAMGDPAFSANIPSDCKASGHEEDTLDTFGANGIIGVGLFNPDCGDTCTNAANEGNPVYYACASGGACAAVGVPVDNQLPNPIAKMTNGTATPDNNGILIELPAIDDSGAASPQGSLILGIGTQTNNKIDKEKVYTATNDGLGTFETQVGGQTYDNSFFDSGTTDLSFPTSAIVQCTGMSQGFYCPNATQIFSASLRGEGAAPIATGTLGFKVANISVLFNSSTTTTAFDDIADTGLGAGVFDWGLPIFFGHRMFFAIAGASTPYGAGPYFAL
jgi:hypothetical protein